MNGYQNETITLIELLLKIYEKHENKIFLAFPLKAC